MIYYKFSPEVAGGLGSKTILDNSTFPPKVNVLNYHFEGWLEDDILETFPCFIVTEKLKLYLDKSKLTGFTFSELLVTTSDTFKALYNNPQKLPNFFWLKVDGKIGIDDFTLSDLGELLISENAYKTLKKFNIKNASIEKIA
jgi:hypothetical protein